MYPFRYNWYIYFSVLACLGCISSCCKGTNQCCCHFSGSDKSYRLIHAGLISLVLGNFYPGNLRLFLHNPNQISFHSILFRFYLGIFFIAVFKNLYLSSDSLIKAFDLSLFGVCFLTIPDFRKSSNFLKLIS